MFGDIMTENQNETMARIFLVQCILANRMAQNAIDKAFKSCNGRTRPMQASQYQSGYVELNVNRVMLRKSQPGDDALSLGRWGDGKYVIMNESDFFIQDTWEPSDLKKKP